MVLSAVLLLAASAHAAPLAAPSFDAAIAEIHGKVLAQRAGAAKARAAALGPNLDSYAWDLERYDMDVERLRRDQTWLAARARRYQPPQPGQPDPDPSLRWDVQRFARDVQSLVRDAQWRVNDLRWALSQATADPALLRGAERLDRAARELKDAARWLRFDTRFTVWDYRRAGFAFESWDIDRGSDDLERHAEDLLTLSGQILAKVKGPAA